MIVGITVLTYLSSLSMLRALMMAGVGLIISAVGMDTISGQFRFTFGIDGLLEGEEIKQALFEFEHDLWNF